MSDVVHAGLVELVFTVEVLVDHLQRYKGPSSLWTRRLITDPLASLVVSNFPFVLKKVVKEIENVYGFVWIR